MTDYQFRYRVSDEFQFCNAIYIVYIDCTAILERVFSGAKINDNIDLFIKCWQLVLC